MIHKPSVIKGRHCYSICDIAIVSGNKNLNSFPPSVAYMRQWIWSALLQIMAFRLFGNKPSFKLMLGYCQFELRKNKISENWIKNKLQNFLFMNIHLQIPSEKWQPCCPGRDELENTGVRRYLFCRNKLMHYHTVLTVTKLLSVTALCATWNRAVLNAWRPQFIFVRMYTMCVSKHWEINSISLRGSRIIWYGTIMLNETFWKRMQGS